MKILVLCHKPPFPAVDGGSIAMSNLIRGLTKNKVELDILAMNTFKQYCTKDKQRIFQKEVRSYQLVDVDIRIKAFDAMLNLFSSKSYNISRFQSSEYKKKLIQLLEDSEYDVVLFESLFSTPYVDVVRDFHPRLIVHRSHNIEFNIWQNLAKNEHNLIRKWYLRLLAKRLKKYEIDTVNKFDLVATISQTDLIEYKSNGITSQLYHLPFGIDLASLSMHERRLNNPKVKIYHVGSMNWKPHQEAFRWFFNEVWIGLGDLKAKSELHLAGTEMPKWIQDKSSENVFVSKGYVDGYKFSKDKEILVVPSFSGSGIRIKIIEAMATGKTIVTTANGAMGIECSHRENIYISDKPEEWISYINELVLSSEKREVIGKNARQYCFKYHDHNKLAERLINKLRTTKPKLH